MTVTSRTPAPAPGAKVATAPPSREQPSDKAPLMWKLAQLLVRVWTTVMFDLKVYGLDNVPRTGGVLMVSNHQSLLDPLLLGARLRRPMSYMANGKQYIIVSISGGNYSGEYLAFSLPASETRPTNQAAR